MELWIFTVGKRGIPALGPAPILSQQPHSQPLRSKKSPAPRFEAGRRGRRLSLCAWHDDPIDEGVKVDLAAGR